MPAEDIVASFQETLESVNSGLESHERMSNIIIVNDEWTTEKGLLTPTLKVKRDKLEEKYGELIGKPYSQPVVWED